MSVNLTSDDVTEIGHQGSLGKPTAGKSWKPIYLVILEVVNLSINVSFKWFDSPPIGVLSWISSETCKNCFIITCDELDVTLYFFLVTMKLSNFNI